jgi:molybdate transport system regulatory protein
MAKLSLRIDLDGGGRIGPGKIALLEKIGETGSISAAARAMGMSYKRGWDLVDQTSRLVGGPVAQTRAGGAKGGGAELTDVGRDLVRRYRAIEQAAAAAVRGQMAEFEAGTGL